MKNTGTLFVEAPMNQFIEFCKKKRLKFRGVGKTSFAAYKYLIVLNYTLGQTNMIVGLRASLKIKPKTFIAIN